ncbi:MAG: DUF1343 domain-containing protein [Bacteroidota bacterium]|nr:DUF1343 domain-containing protein [Bacteroidota bacterium]MDP4228837.1 DUF1343 domain-containing protein [Bacteroidota bacterium]MDP4235131.1 DUF1343 domain-containing protein [Bacteroidota bacterium]
MIVRQLFACLLLCSILFSGANAKVRLGLDNLISSKYAQLKHKRVGFICNQTSLTSEGKYAVTLFAKQKEFRLAALFSPEHGLFGQRKAGIRSDSVQKFEGIPVYSLYGATRKPTKQMLRSIDILVFDIQDIGVRPYTFLSTMVYAMEAAAENGIEFVVLDRPNPLSGLRVEGNILDTTLRSFVGALPVPYLHGMTLGELAKMAVGEKWFHRAEKLKFSVITMTGWERAMYWTGTGLKWSATSPNVPTFASAVGCAMFGAIGELGVLSVGIGSDLPFLRIGSKLVKPEILEEAVRSSTPSGIALSREDYTVPFNDSTKTFSGMKIALPSDLGKVGNFYAGQFTLLSSLVKDSVFARSYSGLPASTKMMFGKVTGSHALAKAIGSERELNAVFDRWKQDVKSFRNKRRKYLLYQ